jgi:hypothetical protein
MSFPRIPKISSPSHEFMTTCLLVLLIAAVIFPLRKVFITPEASILGQYSDFTSFSLYLSDLLIATIVLSLLFSKFIAFRVHRVTICIFFAISLIFITNIGSQSLFYLYSYIKWLELLLIFEIIYQLYSQKFPKTDLLAYISSIFIILTCFIAIIQTSVNHSVGLKWLGEQILDPAQFGVAKLVAHGTPYLRGYGTFPHPNVFSAFIIAGLALFLWLSPRAKSRYAQVYIVACCFILGFTQILTFSRGGILATIGFLGFSSILLAFKIKISKITWICIISAAFGLLMAFTLNWSIISPRGGLEGESLDLRVLYNKIGINIVKSDPYTGKGLGQSVLHMEQYSPTELQPWDKQPIHNYFLLAASEGGVFFLLLLLVVILYPIFKLGRSIWNHSKEIGESTQFTHILLFSLLCTFLLLMQIDHYFYTLEQGKFLLWVVLALSYGALAHKDLKSPH